MLPRQCCFAARAYAESVYLCIYGIVLVEYNHHHRLLRPYTTAFCIKRPLYCCVLASADCLSATDRISGTFIGNLSLIHHVMVGHQLIGLSRKHLESANLLGRHLEFCRKSYFHATSTSHFVTKYQTMASYYDLKTFMTVVFNLNFDFDVSKVNSVYRATLCVARS